MKKKLVYGLGNFLGLGLLSTVAISPTPADAATYFLAFTELGNTVTISSDLPITGLNGFTISIATGAYFPGNLYYQSPGSQGGENALGSLPGYSLAPGSQLTPALMG